MKDCGTAYHGKHLKIAINYILNPEKTQNGRLVKGINCQPELAYNQMKSTKKKFLKEDKRQGYHFIISFKKGEVTPDVALEITEKFAKEYIGSRYETVIAVHDNTEHIHSHIIMNSVSFVDGKKYRYEKGDWAKYIQPITNRLCKEYGLSVIDLEEERSNKDRTTHYKEWNEIRDGKFIWSDMIKRDIDSAKYLQQLWKKVRKQGGLCTGITQNIVDLLQNYTATTMLANSEFVALLKQANTDSAKMAEVIGVSEAQLRFVTNTGSGMGLIKCGSVVVPFDNTISKDTGLYKLYNTNIHERIEMAEKEKAKKAQKD